MSATESLPTTPAAEVVPRPLSLRVNFVWTLAGNVTYAGCQWGMLMLLAKLGSAEMVGEFSLGLAITAPVFMFANLNTRSVQATDAKREFAFGDYLGLRLVTTLLAVMVITGIVLATGYGWHTAAVVLLLGLAKAVESISDVFFGLLQQHERMDRIATSMILKGVLSLAALGAVVYATGSILLGAAVLAGAWAAVLVAYDVRSGALVQQGLRNLFPSWRAATLARLAWVALPLGVVLMLISLNTNIPRYFLEGQYGLRDLGIFSAMAYLMVAGNTVVNALGHSASPRLARLYASGDRPAFRSLLGKLLLLGVALGVGGVLFALVAGPQVLTLLYKPEYAEHADVLVWLMVAAGLGWVVSFLGHGMTAARSFRIQAPLLLLVSLTTVIGCAVLVPSMGLVGAAVAMVIAAAVHLAGAAVIVAVLLRKGGPAR